MSNPKDWLKICCFNNFDLSFRGIWGCFGECLGSAWGVFLEVFWGAFGGAFGGIFVVFGMFSGGSNKGNIKPKTRINNMILISLFCNISNQSLWLLKFEGTSHEFV